MSDIPRRDPLVNEAIEILDRHFKRSKYDFAVAFNTLGHVEDQFIMGELKKCKTNPRYYLENYHIIQTEDRGFTTLYPFWDSQEIFYNEIMEMVLAGVPVKVIVLKARQLGLCLDENTRVLTADLRWVAVKDIQPGDEIVAVDEGQTAEQRKATAAARTRKWRSRKRGEAVYEEATTRRRERKMRTGFVTAKCVTFQEAIRFTFEDGRTLVSSPSHRWLCLQRGGCEPEWREVQSVRVGDCVRYVTKPWEQGDYEDGWFGGFLDGEGSIRQKSPESGGSEVSVSQTDNVAYERARNYLAEQEYSFRVEPEKNPRRKSKHGKKPVNRLVVSRMDEMFRLIGKTRPSRLLGKRWWEGKSLPGKNSGIGWSRVVKIEELPDRKLIDLQTTTKTFIAEGFVSHNSTISEGLIFHRTVFNQAINSLIVAQDPGQAAYLFDMFTRAYDNLPWWMKPEKLFRSKGKYMVFDTGKVDREGLGSQILVEAANKLTGVSVGRTIRTAHLSELSDWDSPETLTEQIFPTMNARDELAIMESTARGRSGRGKFWYDFWNNAVDKWGDGLWEWKPIFIEWFRCSVSTIDKTSVGKYARGLDGETFEPTADELAFREKIKKETLDGFVIPDEMLKWRRYKIDETVAATGDSYGFQQEYPSNHYEAFVSSGTCAFPRATLTRIMNTTCCDPLWVGEIDYHHGENQKYRLHLEDVAEKTRRDPSWRILSTDEVGHRLRVWEKPETGESYYIGADVAHGIEGRDYSCAQIIRIGRGGAPDAQVAEWHGWISPTPFGDVLAALGYWYNTCEIASEINDCGQKTYMQLYRILEYPYLFRWKHYDRVKNFYSDLMAWQTTSKTRPLLITKMRESIIDNTIRIYSYDTVDELFTFASDDDGGRFEGQDNNDDQVFALMIAVWCAHDSDYGMQAASSAPVGPTGYFVLDGQGRVVESCHRKNPDTQKFDPLTRDEAVAMLGRNPTWSVRRQVQRRDLVNTDFSPVFDRPGPRANMHFNLGIPAEGIRLDNIVEEGRNQDADDWRNY